MGLTTAMYTGLTGMSVNQTRIATIGNNIANVNTTAFKSSRTLFQTQMSQTFTNGSSPAATGGGGVNPTQLGFGAAIASTQKNMTPGTLEATGIASDLAIQGNGFFMVNRPGSGIAYTRDGAFSLDANNRLVSSDGYAVRGFGVDGSFNVVRGTLTDLTVPLGTMSLARATSGVQMNGELSAAGTIATLGSSLASQALVDGTGAPATASTPLSDVRPATSPFTPMFAAGNTLTLDGATRGGRTLPTQSFTVGSTGSTLGEFGSWLQSAAGIQTGAGLPGAPGVSIAGGQLVVNGNAGEPNALSILPNNIRSDNGSFGAPFAFTQTQAANGTGQFTSFTVYDSLGTPVQVNATFTLESTPSGGPVWRYYLDTRSPAGATQALGSGTVTFDNNGNFASAAGNTFSIDRSGTGALSPLAFSMDLSQVHGLSTQNSEIVMSTQDGFPPGTLINFGVGADGTINGVFSNGLSRVLGQVAIAQFSNDQGLVAEADNLFLLGPNAGEPLITAPGEFGAGMVIGGALEGSNVDLAREFIGLITSSTGFQAASRVISTSSDMLEQLLLASR